MFLQSLRDYSGPFGVLWYKYDFLYQKWINKTGWIINWNMCKQSIEYLNYLWSRPIIQTMNSVYGISVYYVGRYFVFGWNILHAEIAVRYRDTEFKCIHFEQSWLTIAASVL